MAVSETYLNYILDQLSELDGIDTKRMFGGVGFFKDGVMFGKIGSDVFRLKVDETNEQKFISAGMKPFEHPSKKKGMPYWEVPVDVIESKSTLLVWAKESYEIAIKLKK